MKRSFVLFISILILFAFVSCSKDQDVQKTPLETNGNTIANKETKTDDSLLQEVDYLKEIDFKAQYVRTDGFHEVIRHPITNIIRQKSELDAYYNENRDDYYLERRETVYSDTTIGFLDACDKYDDEYFKDHILLMVVLQEGSGSNRHKVNSVYLTGKKITIDIETLVPECGTSDEAIWHILIELRADEADVSNEPDIEVLIDGKDPLDQPLRASYNKNYANISLDIPKGWEYDIKDIENSEEFCISFWNIEQEDNKIEVWYKNGFGVCGTGLIEEDITIGDYKAYKGTYNDKVAWDFIAFVGAPGQYVIINDNTDTWYKEYADEIMQILETIEIANYIIFEDEAIEIAKKEATINYDSYIALFDQETGLWSVSFYKQNTAGGDQTVFISYNGKLIENIYGE